MSDPTASGLSSRLARFNPFKIKTSREDDEDDAGDLIDSATVAGGGHSAGPTDVTRLSLRISDGLKAYLAQQGAIGEDDPESLQALVEKPHLSIPAYVSDRSHPLPEYFISSSHNTYLMAHQLFGASDAGIYENVLGGGARCVEIDAWDNPADVNAPEVTHGFTLVSDILFSDVCLALRAVLDREAVTTADPAPILLSLENHCGPEGQLRLVEIMKETLGEHLLLAPITDENAEDHVRLADLTSKILVIVEHHLPTEAAESDTSSSSSDDEDTKTARAEYSKKKAATPSTIIIPDLAALGVYAQSVKPSDASWFGTDGLANRPHHHMINVSEAGLGKYLPGDATAIAAHNAQHLMRVFPKGTRISSTNLHPVPFWGVGAQVAALNWSKFDAGMQLNEALFAGTDGFVLKPAALRAGGDEVVVKPKKVLRLTAAGATDIPLPKGREAGEIKPYLTCTLAQPAGNTKRKTGGYKQRGDREPAESPVWEEVLEWEYEETELDFLRLLIKSDDSFASNPVLAVAAVRLVYVVAGEWVVIPMLDLKGHDTKCSLVVKFDIEDV
ncbi:phosphatidylinositol-specific phospholipase C [Lasiosphaeria hispida]|uniref:Phosphoinositide phospholipase C n=1 Tax=Lasiosphaeria hispida TaxID=260671 RepID=A0AAJ0HKQ8_9PEZI|nr:phosphatidylinositol-specific phospholipase C [Lasiosphaeria hispida]